MLRLLICTVSILFSITSLSAHITLNGHAAFYDSLTSTWLCSIPKDLFGKNWTTTISITDTITWSHVKIQNKWLNNDSVVTFTEIDGNKRYKLTKIHLTDTVNQFIEFTYLPIFSLKGQINNSYNYCETRMALPDKENSTQYLARIKYRGATTNLPNRHKHNYHIKFVNADSSKANHSFFGLRKDNSWLLDAGQIDMARIRNKIATEIWIDMCRPVYYAQQEPKSLNGVRGQMIELFVDNEYQGIYSMTEALDRKQMKLEKYDDTEKAFHGMLWKTISYTPITMMRKFFMPDNNENNWQGIEIKYPDPDDIMPTDWSTIAQAVDFVANSSNSDFIAHVNEYFDIPVIMDYWIMINALLAVDNGAKNIYWAVYDQTQNKKITLAAWDLDCTVGQNWINDPYRDQNIVSPTKNLNSFNRLMLRLHELNPNNFCVKSVERYRALRNNILNSDSLFNRYYSCINMLKQCGAARREVKRWSEDSDLSYHKLDFDDELNYIKQWLGLRLDYVDKNRFRPYIKGDVNRDGMIDVADLNLLINKILSASDYPMWYEDLYPDDIYDIADINALINIIIH